MKKTIKINLGGVVFHIDEDAYDLLRNYLDQLDARFKAEPGGSEILTDIETRMAELFQSKITPEKEVLTLAEAREIIDVMGEPEEIVDEAPGEEEVPYIRQTGRRGRRMYRDPDNQIIGGVCSGLGGYLNIDPVFVRILFVIFTLAYGIGLLIYILMWIVIPEARTAAEKLEMFGEQVNVYNIEKKVRQEYRQTTDSKGEPVARRRGNFIGRFLQAIGRIILMFFKVIGFIVLGSMAIAGTVLLASLVAVAVGGHTWFMDPGWNDGMFRLRDVFGLFISPVGGTIGFIALILLVAIPVLSLIYWLAKIIFHFKANDKAVGMSSFGVWVIALIVLLVIGINEGMQYSNRGSTETETELTMPQNKTLLVKAMPEPEYGKEAITEFDRHSEFRIAGSRDSVSILIRPKIYIEYTRDSVPAIHVVKRAHGTSYSIARQHADEIRYTYVMSDTVLTLEPIIRLTGRDRFHVQSVEVTIDLPEGSRVYLDANMQDLLHGVRNTENTWSADLVGEEWVMTPEGLSRVLQNQPAGGI